MAKKNNNYYKMFSDIANDAIFADTIHEMPVI